MPRTSKASLEGLTLPQKHANAVASVAAIQPHLPLNIYASLGTKHAARAVLRRVRAIQPAQLTSTVLEFDFEFNGKPYKSPCTMGWDMVEAVRQHDNPGEGRPVSSNFDGWRRDKIQHGEDIMTLGDFFTPDVRAGTAVWRADHAVPKGPHKVLRNIIERDGDGLHHVWTGPPVFQQPVTSVPHRRRKRRSAENDVHADDTAEPEKKRKRRNTSSKSRQRTTAAAPAPSTAAPVPAAVPSASEVPMIGSAAHARAAATAAAESAMAEAAVQPLEEPMSLAEAEQVLQPLLTNVRALMNLDTVRTALERFQNMSPAEFQSCTLPGDVKNMLQYVAQRVQPC